MSATGRTDLVRQAANVVGAVFQAVAGVFFVANLSAEPVADGRGATPIDPAGYAFFVWAPILLLSLAYAAYGALPSNREDPLLRRIGWFSAGAFFLNGLWEVASLLGRLGIAQVLMAGILVCLAGAYLRLVRGGDGRRALGRADRWLVAPAIGLYFGWITAANAVSLTSLASRSGLVDGGGAGGALLGSALLLLGTVFAVSVILAGRGGPRQGYLSYGVVFLWALWGIVVNQYDASVPTTAVAALCAGPVALALLGALPGSGDRAGGRTARPGVVR